MKRPESIESIKPESWLVGDASPVAVLVYPQLFFDKVAALIVLSTTDQLLKEYRTTRLLTQYRKAHYDWRQGGYDLVTIVDDFDSGPESGLQAAMRLREITEWPAAPIAIASKKIYLPNEKAKWTDIVSLWLSNPFGTDNTFDAVIHSQTAQALLRAQQHHYAARQAGTPE